MVDIRHIFVNYLIWYLTYFQLTFLTHTLHDFQHVIIQIGSTILSKLHSAHDDKRASQKVFCIKHSVFYFIVKKKRTEDGEIWLIFLLKRILLLFLFWQPISFALCYMYLRFKCIKRFLTHRAFWSKHYILVSWTYYHV